MHAIGSVNVNFTTNGDGTPASRGAASKDSYVRVARLDDETGAGADTGSMVNRPAPFVHDVTTVTAFFVELS